MPRYSPEFFEDLNALYQAYVEYDLPESGRRLIAGILDRCKLLDAFPEMGASLESKIGRETPYRSIVCGRILVFYIIEEGLPVVLRAIDSRRDCIRVLAENGIGLRDRLGVRRLSIAPVIYFNPCRGSA